LSELIKRVLVAVIGIPIAMLIVYEGDIAFIISILIISSLALYEFYKIAEKKDSSPNYLLGFLFNTFIILTYGFCLEIFEILNIKSFQIWLFFVISISTFTTLVMGSEVFRSKRNPLSNIGYTLLGTIYVSFSFSIFIVIRGLHELKNISVQSIIDFEEQSSILRIFDDEFCMLFFMFILFSVWISDSAAYFIGKSFGKNKLAPKVSPKKTWEGAVAGFVGGVGGFVVLSFFFLKEFPLLHAIIIGVIIGSIGQIGDLAESLIKRDAGVKDSSSIIPGHGGVLDRFDSLLLIMPIILLYLVIIGN